MRRRIGAEAVAQGVDARAHVALAEELAQAAGGWLALGLRGERGERAVDPLDGSASSRPAPPTIPSSARREAQTVLVARSSSSGSRLAALG